MLKYKRTKEELETRACKWWPESLVDIEAESSIIPMLVKTQDSFISILTLAKPTKPESVFDIISSSGFPANLFLKHLMVISDFGSEPLQRVHRDFRQYFPVERFVFSIEGDEYNYQFLSLPTTGTLNNKKMATDVSGILKPKKVDSFYKDLIILLLFGANAVDEQIASIFSKCVIGNMLGNSNDLKDFIKQRYIFVSRITGGAQANSLGNAAQLYVAKYLRERLDDSYSIMSNGHIPGVSSNSRTETTFDISIERNQRFVGVEISFQVTTNSTIERKAGQARARKKEVDRSGNYIAYIIDGAGNFQRKSALETICQYSHCTVAYTDSEFDLLLKFIKEKLNDKVC